MFRPSKNYLNDMYDLYVLIFIRASNNQNSIEIELINICARRNGVAGKMKYVDFHRL